MNTKYYGMRTGLPVLGQGFVFNPKTELGSTFIERGSSSTAELLVQNMTSIVCAARSES